MSTPPENPAPAQRELSLPEVLDLAAGLVQQGRLDDAEGVCQSVLNVLPGHPAATHLRGVILYQRGRNEEALELVRQSIDNLPGLGWPLNNLGNVLKALGRNGEALAAYQRCVTLDPRHADAFSNIAGLLREARQFADSEVACRAALALRPDLAMAWYLLSRVLLEQGRVAEGLVADARSVVLGPRDRDSRRQVAHALVVLDRFDEAAEIYREWLVDEPANVIVQHHLAACARQGVPDRAPDDYVQTVFDRFADSFDRKLAALDYRAPILIGTLLEQTLAAPTAQFDVADLGCGTGLCGPLLRGWARRLIGCDLSEGMLAKAAERGGYDELIAQELVAFLRARPRSFDLLISADTLCYFGDLREVAFASHAALRETGRLVFTVEALPEHSTTPFQLLPQARYAHAASYVRDAFSAAGFARVDMREQVLRTENGLSVNGWLVGCMAQP